MACVADPLLHTRSVDPSLDDTEAAHGGPDEREHNKETESELRVAAALQSLVSQQVPNGMPVVEFQVIVR